MPRGKVNVIPERGLSTLTRIFSDLRVRMGIKVALSAALAFYVALSMRLEHPTWALFTVMLVSLPQYVGAIAEKAALRAVGTTVGGLFGFWLVGNFISTPWVFLPVSFIWIAFFSAMFFGTFYPYAFLLSGLTFIVVVAGSMLEPDSAWTVAKSRILEILVGNLAVLIVSSTIWPRYAVDDFYQTLRAGLEDCVAFYRANSASFFGEEPTGENPDAVALRFQGRLNLLRQLVEFGSRESSIFRSHLPDFQRVVDDVDSIFLAGRTLGSLERDAPKFGAELKEQFRRILEVQAGILLQRSVKDPSTAAPDFSEWDRALEAVEEAIETHRRRQTITNYPIDEIAAVCGMLFSLRQVRDCLEKVTLFQQQKIVSHGTSAKGAYANAILPPMSGIQAGIKGGIGTVIALVLCNWLHPPGVAVIPLVVWVCCIMTGGYYHGQGDRRAFQLSALVALGGIPLVFLAILINPLMSSFLVTNIILAMLMFGFGFWAASIAGVSFGLQVLILAVAGFMGLNQQDPVSVQAVLDVYLGTATGYLLAAFFQRLIWPVLPQHQLRNKFVEFFDGCQELVSRTPGEDAPLLRLRVTLIPSEVTNWIARMTTPDVPDGERERLDHFAESLRRLGYHLRARRNPFEAKISDNLEVPFTNMVQALESAYRESAASYRQAFAAGRSPQSSPALEEALPRFHDLLAKIREEHALVGQPLGLTVTFLGRLYNYVAIGRGLDHVGKTGAKLRFEAYSGDHAL